MFQKIVLSICLLSKKPSVNFLLRKSCACKLKHPFGVSVLSSRCQLVTVLIGVAKKLLTVT